ncbi:MAG: glycoside hydrolase family 88 protein [Clostridia bacterium]|nr:glycoside hydrolase family 88 protein [Clostridia bacterium]
MGRYQDIDRYVVSLIEQSSPERTVWNVEKLRDGIPANWNYVDGCMMNALLSMARITGESRYFRFVDSFIDSFVLEDGSIRGYKPDAHTLDDINEGRVLFELYEKTGKEKYKKAADFLKQRLLEQPRTWEGNFWHKQIYPNQVWLDGVYMAQPFAALYEKYFGSGDYADIVRQVEIVRARMRDEKTGLYYHGYDASKTAFWCDRETGLSRCFWLRAIGWFSVALADLTEILPNGSERDKIADVFARLMADIAPFAAPDTGMYYQVVDQAGREGNYQESSGSSMIAYAMLKGARLGVLDKKFAALGKKTFDGIVDTCLEFADGQLCLSNICLVAGLGPENNRRRDGTYAYYISEPVVKNDAKGVAPFLMCYTEIMLLPNQG